MFATLMAAARDRPRTGPGHYLRDLVYGANDGIITTMAVVAGVTGAALDPAIAVILGLANLLADGVSMGASNYLGLVSELKQTGRSVAREKPWRHAGATGAAFVAAGAVPLGAYLVPSTILPGPRFPVAIVLAGIALAGVGALRTPFLERSATLNAVEMLVVGGAATAIAFAVGWLTQGLA